MLALPPPGDLQHDPEMTSAPYRPWTVIFFSVLVINIDAVSASLERSISVSRQFIIYGASTPLRGAVADLAERTKKDLLTVLQQSDDWKTPIILNLRFPQANVPDEPAVARYFSQTGNGLKLQLDLTIQRDLDVAGLEREIARAVLLEMMYRQQPDLPAGTEYVQPPEWLVEGLLLAGSAEDRMWVREALAPLLINNNVTDLRQFLIQKPALLDSAGQQVYRAYAVVLMQLVLDSPGGSSQLSSYITHLRHASNDPLNDLGKSVPLFSNTSGVEALWKEKLKGFGPGRTSQLLTFAETDRRLQMLLDTGIGATGVSNRRIRLEQLVKGPISAKQRDELRNFGGGLMLLSAQSNPLLRPVVAGYQQVAELAVMRRRKGLERRLAELTSIRARMAARMSDIDDYMNWFEATKSPTVSGQFSGYLKAAQNVSELEHRRHDPLSVYLDVLEREFAKGL